MASPIRHPWPVAPALVALVAAGTTLFIGLDIAADRGLGFGAVFGLLALTAQVAWIVGAVTTAVVGATGSFDTDDIEADDDGHLLVSEGAFFEGDAENDNVQDFALPAFPEPRTAVVMPMRRAR